MSVNTVNTVSAVDVNAIIAGEKQYLVQTYRRPEVVFTHGEGAYLFDDRGNRYLDFTAGIAVNALGHADEEWAAAVSEQAGRLVHVSNLYHTAPHVELAKRLVENSFADRVFFCNSGSEANETALKFARKFARMGQAQGTAPAGQAQGTAPAGQAQGTAPVGQAQGTAPVGQAQGIAPVGQAQGTAQAGQAQGTAQAGQAQVTAPTGLGKTKIVAFSGSFHGRTMGALSTTYKDHYREPFAPLVPGVTFVPFNDLDAARAAIDDDTCAVIVEPIQGEGGINPAGEAFLSGLRELCDQHRALLIFDEVQCGLGRSGTLWAYQPYGVTPDMMTLAKPLAGGLPIGAALVTEAVAQAMGVGDHGSTFAAGPLVCRAAQVVFDRVNRPEFLASVRDKGAYLVDLLKRMASDGSQGAGKVTDVRGRGLLVGVELNIPVAPLIAAARDKGLLVINAGENVLRLCPPLIISNDQIETAVATLGQCLGELEG